MARYGRYGGSIRYRQKCNNLSGLDKQKCKEKQKIFAIVFFAILSLIFLIFIIYLLYKNKNHISKFFNKLVSNITNTKKLPDTIDQ